MTRRAVDLPLDLLDAELVAAPLAHPAAFAGGLITLDPTLRDPATRRLWRAVEQTLAVGFPKASLDELVARRDRVWFGGPGASKQPLRAVLRRVEGHLDRATVEGRTPGLRRRRLRWLTLALPRDLLEAVGDPAVMAEPAVSQPVERLLEEGVVEPHLHLGAAIDFETMWIVAQHRLAHLARADALESPGAVFDEGRGLAPWLIRGLVARGVLARYCASDTDEPFARWLGALSARLPPSDRVVVTRLLGAVATGQGPDSAPFRRVQGLYRTLLGVGPGWRPLPADLDGIRRADTIEAWYSAVDTTSPERRFVRAALERLDAGRADRTFCALFWQTIRLRVLLYRHLVQRPMVGGLQWFTRAFARIAPVRGGLHPRALVEGAQRLSGRARAIELRFKPRDSPARVERQFVAIAEAADGGPDTALIPSFTRVRSDGHKRGRPGAYDIDTHAMPGHGSPFRFGRYYLDRRREARALIELMRRRPGVVESLRGFDVCGDELAVPLWVLTPLLVELRRVGREAAARATRVGRELSPPRLMVHAGEDYVHLLGGLRRLDEFVEYLDLGEGDRVTHALALGEDVDRWCGVAFGRVQAREERLLDLLWAWRRLRDTPGPLLTTWGQWLEAAIRRLGREIFGASHPVDDLAAAHDQLHDPAALHRMGFPGSSDWPVPAELALARRWITERGVFLRGREVIEVDPRPIAPLLDALQRLVRRRLGERSVVVEVNPSSNLLVSALTDLGQHPLWRLRPVEANSESSLTVCIGSDDPITFATTLGAEYQLVYDALIEAGVAPDHAMRWLDDARRGGLCARVALQPSVAIAGATVEGGTAKAYQASHRWPETPQPLTVRTLPG